MGQMGSHVEHEHGLFIKRVSHVNPNMTQTRWVSTHNLFINKLVMSGLQLCQILSPLTLTARGTVILFEIVMDIVPPPLLSQPSVGMHKRGKIHATPASDAATDAVVRASVPRLAFFFLFFSTTRADLHRCDSNSGQIALNRADLRRLGLYRAKLLKWPIQDEIQKKKKGAKCTVWT